MKEFKVSRPTLIAFVGITGWVGLLLLIAYLTYKYTEVAVNYYEILIGSALACLNMFFGKYLFKD